MLRTMLAVIIVTGLSFAALAAEAELPAVGGSSFHKNDITYSTEVFTPHVKWAEKLPGGPVTGFFIPSIEFGRDMVELMQRIPLEPTTVSIDRNWDTSCWGIGDYYGHQFRGNIDDFRQVFAYVEKDLTGPAQFEVMLIPGLNGWSRMTKATRDAILKRVEEGAGLILIHPYVGDIKGHPFRSDPLQLRGNEASNAEDDVPLQWESEVDTRIWDISPLVNCPDDSVSERGYPLINRDALANGKWQVTKPHFITSGVPMDLLPEGNVGGRFYKYEVAKDAEVLIKSGDYPILAVKQYGKGRVVAFAYLEEGFIPEVKDRTEDKIYWNYWEYYYSLLSRTVLWAANRDSAAAIDRLQAIAADGKINISLAFSASSAQNTDVSIDGRSEFGPAMQNARISCGSAYDGRILVGADGDSLPGGKGIYDVIIRDAATGETLNWGSVTFEVPKKAKINDMSASSEVYHRGETISIVTHSGGDLSGVRARMTVTDDLERVIYVESKTTRGERAFMCPLNDFLGKYAFVKVDLVDDKGNIIDQLRNKPILVVQDKRRPREYIASVSFGGGRHFFTAVRTKVIHAAGADTGFTWGGAADNDLNIPRGAFGIYWYDRGPTTPEAMAKAIAEYEKTGDFEGLQYLTKKELYKRTGDKKFLTRVPCFSDPEYMKMLSDIVGGAARAKGLYNFDYYFVGDEGSLTSYGDAFDFCFGSHTLAAFREWLKAQYGSLGALNAKWKTSFAKWEDVMPLTADEAKKAGNFVPWADHRTFMDITFANAYKTVRDAVTKGDPDGHIAVSGTQGTTAFNGCDWYRLDQIIDDFLAYGGGNQWDLHRSFAKPGSMIGFWTGYGSRGIAVQNAIWTAAVHNVLYPNIFWMLSYLDPDFTYSMSARDMGEAFKALKYEGVGKLFLESVRRQDGIAIHWSMASVRASTITAPEAAPRGERPTETALAGPKPNQIVRSLQGSRDGWVTVIKDLGLQFDFVSYDQIEKGQLDPAKYRVFILPSTVALSDKEAAEIRRYAERGGTVIADAGIGLMDDHCAWVSAGQLNDLFGIETAPSESRTLLGEPPRFRRRREGADTGPARATGITGDVKLTAAGSSLGLTADDLKGFEVVEAGVKPAITGGLFRRAASKPLITVGGTDAVFIRNVKKGKAVYLNALLDGYSSERRNHFGGAMYRSLAKALFADAGVKAKYEVLTPDGKPLSQCVVVRYGFGDSEALAIVKENVGLEGVTGYDGVTQYNDANLGQVAKQDIIIKLPAPMFANDVRTGAKMGRTDTVKTSIIVGGAAVLGFAPVENTVALTGPAEAALGDHVPFVIASTPGGKRLVRCHFFAPDGAFLADYAVNVVFDGDKATVVFPSAYNDAPGVYTLKATDVVSGASTEAKITLK